MLFKARQTLKLQSIIAPIIFALCIICTKTTFCQETSILADAINTKSISELYSKTKTKAESIFEDTKKLYEDKAQMLKESSLNYQSTNIKYNQKGKLVTVNSNTHFISPNSENYFESIIIYQDRAIARKLEGILSIKESRALAEYKKAEEEAFQESLEDMTSEQKTEALKQREEELNRRIIEKMSTVNHYIYSKPKNGIYKLQNNFHCEIYQGKIIKIFQSKTDDRLKNDLTFFSPTEHPTCTKNRIDFIEDFFVLKKPLLAHSYQIMMPEPYYPQEINLVIFNPSSLSVNNASYIEPQGHDTLTKAGLSALAVSERREVSCLTKLQFNYIDYFNSDKYYYYLAKYPLIRAHRERSLINYFIEIEKDGTSIKNYNIQQVPPEHIKMSQQILYPPFDMMELNINLYQVKKTIKQAKAKINNVESRGLINVVLSQ